MDGELDLWEGEYTYRCILITILAHQQETSSNFTTSVGAKSVYSIMGKPINGSDLMLFIDSTGEGTAF